MEKDAIKLKKYISVAALLAAGLMLSGCGAAEAETAQPVRVEGLDALAAVFVTPEPSAAPEQMNPSEEQGITVEAEAMGNEPETERKTVKASDIYNQPETDAAVLGSVASGSVVSVIGLAEDEDWYKIDYNGRVAYIQANVLEVPVDDSLVSPRPSETPIPSEEPTPTPEPTSSPKPVSSSGTTSNPTSTPGKTPTPTPGKTPTPTPGKTPTPTPGTTPSTTPTAAPAQTPEVSPSPKPTTMPSVSAGDAGAQ